MDERLRKVAEAAVARGLDFLEGAVTSDGAWTSWRYDDTELAGDRVLEHPPFTAALGALALDACRHPGADALLRRTRRFIAGRMIYPGIWRYPGVPAAVDDTAMCALALGPHPWLRMGRLWGANFGAMLANRDAAGRFVTWFAGDDWPPGLENEVDAVVNANVLGYMGDHPEARAAERWVETAVVDGREAVSSPYYVEAVDLHFAMARATRFREGLFVDLRPTLARLVLERVQSDEGFADPMRAAQALSALDMLQVRLDEATLTARLRALLETQRRDGSWPPCLAWKEPPGWGEYMEAKRDSRPVPARGFASEALTAAFCIEAMTRAALYPNGRSPT